MPIDGFRLGVDFGTSHTVAALRWPDGRIRPLLFDGSPLLHSAVFAGPDGILVGRSAVHAARTRPDGFEPHPKRCIDDGRVLLGPPTGSAARPAGVPVEVLIGAVLRRVATEAARTAGGPVVHTTLTYPAGWGTARKRILVAAGAVFGPVVLVPEPVAAAAHFVAMPGRQVPAGACVMVYDLGAGTVDVSVVRRTWQGFEVLASTGLTDAGGLDIDAAVVAHLGTTLAARDPAVWARLVNPRSAVDRRAGHRLWEDVREAKEILSQATSTHLTVPLFDDDVPLGREELERLARPILDRTVEAARSALRAAGVPPAALAGVYLVGGASRIPLVATLLHRALGVPPTLTEQPELAVAEGSLRAGAPPAVPPHAAPPSTTRPRAVMPTDPPLPAGPPPVPVPAPGVPGGALAVGAAVAAVGLLAAILIVVVALWGDGRAGDPGGNRTGSEEGNQAGGSAAPAAGAAAIDSCLVGAWRGRSHDLTFADLRMTSAGGTYRFRRDGVFTVDYGAGITFTNDRYSTFRITWIGKMSATVETAEGQIIMSGAKADGRQVFSGGGVVTGEQPLQASAGPIGYRCAGDSAELTVSSAADRQTIALARRSTDPGGG